MTIGPSGTFAYVAVVPESGIASLLSPRDTLFMARNSCGGLALSMVRDGQLVAAVGAISDVPLGDLIRVRIPADVIEEAERVYRRHDPEFEYGHLPGWSA